MTLSAHWPEFDRLDDRDSVPITDLKFRWPCVWDSQTKRDLIRPLFIPKISSGADPHNEAESAHHSTRCLRSFTCL